MVVAIVGGGEVHLVESNGKKCAFLRAAARETGANAVIHEARIEDFMSDLPVKVDCLSARALAPLTRLLELAAPLMTTGVPAAFHKGRNSTREIAEATQSWDFDLVQHQSRISGGGVILEIRRLQRKQRSG